MITEYQRQDCAKRAAARDSQDSAFGERIADTVMMLKAHAGTHIEREPIPA